MDWRDFKGVETIAKANDVELVVIGPDNPVAEGLADALRETGLPVFGPSRAAAQLEASKVFAKRFMVAAGIPTARYHEVNSVASTLEAAKEYAAPYVLKADGLAAGKGVFVCKNLQELEASARDVFDKKVFAKAGDVALLEEFSPGYEISCLVLTNGETWEPLVLAADHKRLKEDDQGPNTGGMGAVAPYWIDLALQKRIDAEVLSPTFKRMKEMNLFYRGVLYVGLMITNEGPSVLEFNARFGDPEAQVVLPLLDGDWGQAFKDVAQGRVPLLKWKNSAAACVVLAAEGYPEAPKKGVRIQGDLVKDSDDTYFLHAGTARKDGAWTTDGGRVLNAVGLGRDVRAAVAKAYEQAERAQWPGRQMRTDIGARVFETKKP